MKMKSPIAFVVVVALSAGLFAQAKPNFSGEWVMVPEKSDFGPVPAPATMTRTIAHQDPILKIVTVQTGGATGDRKIETTFSTDGKPQKNTIIDNPMTTTGKWADKTIVLTSTMSTKGEDGGVVDVRIEDRMSLSDDGNTLTLTRKIAAPDGEMTAKVVMVKK
jgi:hypothetical protein